MSNHRLGSHSKMLSGIVGLGIGVGLMYSSTAFVPMASAQEEAAVPDLSTADGIIAELENISRGAEAVSEEVTALDDQVRQKEEDLHRAEDELKASEEKVARAQGDLDSLSGDISYLAKKRMRGEVIDPLSAALGSYSPQDAIDRASYLNKLVRDNEEVVTRALQARKTAESGKDKSVRLQADIRRQLDDLNKHRDELMRRSEEFDGRTEQVKAMVDALSPEQRQIWITKNNPITEGLQGLFGSSAAVDAAMAKLGAPYSWGSAGPDAFDCSGLMYWAYQQIGKSIPRTSQAQLAGGTPVSRDQLQPGDIIGFYPGITHVGMYVGNGKIIHASDYGIPVQVVSIDQGGPYQGAVRY